MSIDEQTNLLGNLQSLLEKQIKLARQGNVSGVEVLSKQADGLVSQIRQSGTLGLAEFKNRREHLQKLYEELCLTLAAAKADTAEKLSRVRKGKKAAGTYRNNV